jgi:hypothetical protein
MERPYTTVIEHGSRMIWTESLMFFANESPASYAYADVLGLFRYSCAERIKNNR